MDDALRSFFGFHTPPFGPVNVTAPQIQPASRRALIDKAASAILTGRSVITVAGEHGAGKTTLIKGIAAFLQGRQILAIEVASTLRRPAQLQQIITAALGIDGQLESDPQHWLRAAHPEGAGRTIVLLFDDADTMSAPFLRYLWLLLRLFEFGAAKLHLVFVGGLGRWPGLEHPDLAKLRQLADPRIIIKPLEDDEAAAYVDGQLRLAGGSRRRIMTDAGLSDLLERACGVPGRLNALTESALAYAYQYRRPRIIAPILPVAPAGEPETILASAPMQPSWRSVSIAALILVAAVGAGTVFKLRTAPALDANIPASPDWRRSSVAPGLQERAIRLTGSRAAVRIGSR